MTIKDGTFFRIEAFMRNDLNLKGNELMAYALIYGFQKATGKPFQHGQDFISEWTGASRPTIIKSLQNLEDKGLISSIVKRKGYPIKIDYTCNMEVLKDSSNCQKTLQLESENGNSNCQKTLQLESENGNSNCQKTLQFNCKKSDTQLLKNFTPIVKKLDNIYTDNKINTNIHTDRDGTEFSKEKCLKTLKAISINSNALFDPDLKTEFSRALSKLSDSEHPLATYELAYAWNSYQAELKSEGREAQYMPNLKKWLKNDAVTKVSEYRAGKKYSLGRVTRTIERIVKERNIA